MRVAFRLAFWELFHAPSFEAGLTDVVNRGGDADTNGAIAGALLGANFGVMAIPSRWRAAVLDAPPDARLGDMAEACHPARMFRREWGLSYTAPRGREPQAVQFAEWYMMPMPQARVRLPLNASYTKEELGRIVLGVLPEEMEDKWFIYTEDGVTHFHRSWTGIEIFRIRLTPMGYGAIVTEAWANRDAKQFGSVDDEEDKATLCHLIDVLLLDRPSGWPGTGTEANPLAEWSVMGRSMLAHDATGKKAGKMDAAIRAGARTPRRRKARKKPSDPGA